MHRLILSIITALVLSSSSGSQPRIRASHRICRQCHCRLKVLSNPHAALTLEQLQHQNKAIAVMAAYFWPLKRTRRHSPRPVDFVFVNGHTVQPYRGDLGRPVVASNRTTGKIKYFDKFRNFLAEKNRFTDALAGDKKGQRPNDRCWRILLGFKGEEIHFFRMVGTAAGCKRRMRRLGMDHFLFFDSGSSADPGTKSPFCFGLSI